MECPIFFSTSENPEAENQITLPPNAELLRNESNGNNSRNPSDKDKLQSKSRGSQTERSAGSAASSTGAAEARESAC